MEIPAGVDFGSTLTKAYWRAHDGTERYMTVPAADQCVLAYEMQREGVSRVRRTGIGQADEAITKRFEVIGAPAGAVDDEIALQARGTKGLLYASLVTRPVSEKKLIVASIGTGASYTKVKGKKAKRYPLGSAHAGGTVLGLGKLLGAGDFKSMEAAAANGKAADLLVKDQVPATDGTPLGELAIAHFCKDGLSLEDRCASVFSFAACSIAKDLAILTAFPFSPKHIVVVGTLGGSPVFRRHLERWTGLLLKKQTLHFPAEAGYAAALGAWMEIRS